MDGAQSGSGSGKGQSRRQTVAFLGPPASYSHQATKATFSELDWEFVPVVTIKDIFDEVQAGRAAYGVVPFENSTYGTVTLTLDGLADRAGTYADLVVCGEVYVSVHHCLLGRLPPPSAADATSQEETGDPSPGACTPTNEEAVPSRPRARPVASLRHISRVYSHPQGLGQTAAFLGAYLRGVDAVDVSSTSRAAELAAADATGTTAAVSSEMAAELYGLDVLARRIEDRDDNTTRFFILRSSAGSRELGRRGVNEGARREGQEGGQASGLGSGSGSEGQRATGQQGSDPAVQTETASPTATAMMGAATTTAAAAAAAATAGTRPEETKEPPKKTKSLVSFSVPHRSPGALAGVLDCFRRAGLNLTSINSLPSLIRPFQYLFFVEFEGSLLPGDDDEGQEGRAAVSGALEDVGKVAQSWRWLGSWEDRSDSHAARAENT